jgi:signal transduction histidine kinase
MSQWVWKTSIEEKAATGNFAGAADVLREHLRVPCELKEEIALRSHLILLLVHQSRYPEAHELAREMEKHVGCPRVSRFLTVPIAYVVCVFSALGLGFLERGFRTLGRRVALKFLKPEATWDAAYGALWGLYWHNIDLALQYNLLTYFLAETPAEIFRSKGFLSFSLAFKGHPICGLSSMRRTMKECDEAGEALVLQDLYVFWCVVLQMSSRASDCFEAYDRFEKYFPTAPPFLKIICSASRLNASFSEHGPSKAHREVDRCLAISVALKESRNHIQIYGAKAALLAMEGRPDEAREYLQKSRLVAERNANALDSLIYQRFAAATYLNLAEFKTARQALSDGRALLKQYGSPSWYEQELDRIETVLVFREEHSRWYCWAFAAGFALRALSYGNIHRFRKAKRVLRFLTTDADAMYWPSQQCRDFLAERLLDKEAEAEKQTLEETSKRERAAISKMARQVAHDIKSPLTLLSVITDSARDLPDETKNLLRTAVNRIRDITNDLSTNQGDLLRPSAPLTGAEGTTTGAVLMPTLIEAVLSAKRTQYRSQSGVEIYGNLSPSSYGAFASVDGIELKNTLGELIDNAVEALATPGTVSVDLSATDSKISVAIKDNGVGIPADLIPALGKRGFSFGKSGHTGLGLHEALENARKWQGKLSFDSQFGRGTTVTLEIPRAAMPSWFLPKIDIAKSDHVVILDDDDSMHGVWAERFKTARDQGGTKLVHLKTGPDAKRWLDLNRHQQAVFLFDYELIGAEHTGLDWIEKLGIEDKAALVTSHFENPTIRDRCEKLSVPLIPKLLAGSVPIQA